MTDKPELKPCPFCGVVPSFDGEVYHQRMQAPAAHRSCILERHTGTAEDWNRRAPRFSQEELEAMRECAERTQDEYSGTELWVPLTAAATLFRMIEEGSNGR